MKHRLAVVARWLGLVAFFVVVYRYFPAYSDLALVCTFFVMLSKRERTSVRKAAQRLQRRPTAS